MTNAQVPNGPTPETYIFAIRGEDTLRMDVYHPQNPRPDKAVVLHFHGGAFMFNSRNDSLSLETCQLLAEKGYTAISADYRLTAAKVKFDTLHMKYLVAVAKRVFGESTEDAAAAVAFLCQHAQEWDVDTGKIVLTGSSAGAVMVLNLDYCRANDHQWAKALPKGVRFAAVIPYAGAIYSYGKTQYMKPPSPTCFFHGDKDRIVNYKDFSLGKHHLYGSSKLSAYFKENGHDYCFYRIRGHAHEVARLMPKTYEEFNAFVNMALSGRKVQQETDCWNVKCYVPPVAGKGVMEFIK